MLVPSGEESWTVIGPDLRPLEPVERYLAWLSRIERAPTTVRAYAHDLKTYWSFLAGHAIEWDAVTLEQLGSVDKQARRIGGCYVELWECDRRGCDW